MKYRLSIVILLLCVSLALQNTCPQGWAGKSSAVGSCAHCPHRQQHLRSTDSGGTLSITSASTVHPPLFLLDIPDTQPLFRLAAVDLPQPVIANIYTYISPDELLRPPRS